MRTWRALTVVGLLLGACATPEVASKTGASFREVKAEPPALPAEALYAVCWPQDAGAAERVVLSFLPDGVVFEAREGASNSTGRCLRELASSYPFAVKPNGSVTVAPPAQPIDGWAVLAWVKLLSASRYGPERGLLDPAPLARACLDRGPTRGNLRFAVRHVPGPQVRLFPEAASEADRCLEAVVGAIAWPSSREVFFDFPRPGPPPTTGDVSRYFTPPGPSLGSALEPGSVREAIHQAQPKVAACWEAALARRASLGGARTFRFRVSAEGAVTAAWVASTMGGHGGCRLPARSVPGADADPGALPADGWRGRVHVGLRDALTHQRYAGASVPISRCSNASWAGSSRMNDKPMPLGTPT